MKIPLYVYIAYGVTLAIVLTAAVLPASSWAVKNHIDLLTGGWKLGSGFPEGILPQRLIANLTSEKDFYPVFTARQDDSIHFKTYIDQARQNPRDPAKLAHMIRRSLSIPIHVPPNQKLPQPFWDGVNVDRIRGEAKWAAQEGLSIDPDNAFFPIMLTLLYDWEVDSLQAAHALERAGKCARFDEYANEEAEDQYAILLRLKGYRGEKPRAVFLSSVILPHYASLKYYAKELKKRPQTKEVVQAQADLLRVAATMERTSPYVIAIFVGGATTRIILRPLPEAAERKLQSVEEELRISQENIRDFNALQKKLGVERPYDPKGLVGDTMRISAEAGGAFPFESAKALEQQFTSASTFPAPTLLLAIILSVAFAAFMYLMKPESEVGRRLLPFIAAPVAYWVVASLLRTDGDPTWQPAFHWGSHVPLMSELAGWATFWGVVLGFMQMFRPLRLTSVSLGLLGCALIAFWTYPIPYLFLPSLTFVGCLLLTKAPWKLPYAVIFAALLLTCVAMGFFVARQSVLDDVFIAYVLTALALTAFLFVANGSRRALSVAPVVTLVLACGYLFTVVQEVRQNEEVRVGLASWSKEADLLRAKANISAN